MNTNPQIELAERYVMETGVSIFLTGKAGTGKTTFLHHIVERCPKRSVVLAPTGVAAVNAGGVTIHSFFQLPFCPYLPDVKELVTEYQMPEQKRQLRKSKIDIIRTLDLLIIDEISMVRADLLDAIDDTLRRYRRSSRPFGGVQLLMIGDVQQLAPVVTDDEKPYMDRVYPSPFFFHSKALQRLPLVTIQLTTIYRQQDPTFVNLLNNIRDAHFDQATLDALNTRVKPSNQQINKSTNQQQEPILLTTHNYQADRVNQRRLEELSAKPFTLNADIEGNFPESNYPTDAHLTLKPGAQVMFVKNDTSSSHRYFNGKIGTVDSLATEKDEDGNNRKVVLVIDEDGETIKVSPETWENIKYEIDPKDNQIKQQVDGTFAQYPLRTAWAITIHKAQGLTFDRVQVDASAAFTYGQVYVALSRCRSLEGLTLLSPITARNVFGSSEIEQFNASFMPPEQVESCFTQYRQQYYFDVLFELFGFSALQHDVEQIDRLFQSHLRTTYPQHAQTLMELTHQVSTGMVDVSARFCRQLGSAGSMPQPEAQQYIQDRISKAAPYFLDQLSLLHKRIQHTLTVSVDNKEVSARLKELAEHYLTSHGLKVAVLTCVQKEGFKIATYQKAKVDFALEKPKKLSKSADADYSHVKHPLLVPLLTAWRRNAAEEANILPYLVMHQKTLLAIADTLPRTKSQLQKVPGMGKVKVAQFGPGILQVIADYCQDSHIDTDQPMTFSQEDEDVKPKKEKKPKDEIPTWQRAAELFARGKTVKEVASEMMRAPSTVEGYLLTAVENGAMDANLVVPAEAQDEIVEYMLEQTQLTGLKAVYEHFEGRYSYLQLRVTRFAARDVLDAD